ncbi:MAG TPA: hypothetical protein ENH12_00040 [Proteobacteria bacterium]|nr:hypothetical protein [Pseudomonadota bacterium]
MKCSDREKTISDYLDGALGPSEQRELEEHLKVCPHCRESLKEMKQIDQLARQSMPADDPSPESWAERWPVMRNKILGECEKSSRPPSLSFFSRAWGRPSLAAAAVITLLVAAGLLWKVTSPETGVEKTAVETEKPSAGPVQAENPAKAPDFPGDIIPTGTIRKDLALFCGIQKSFSHSVKWVAIDGELVDFGLSSQKPDKEADRHQALLFLDFKIQRMNVEPEEQTVSSPRIIVRNAQEINNNFALPPETGLTYQLRTTPRIEKGGKITLDVELVFHQINDRGEERARISVSPTLEPGDAITLGSVLPGNDLYQIIVLATFEDSYPFQPCEKI